MASFVPWFFRYHYPCYSHCYSNPTIAENTPDPDQNADGARDNGPQIHLCATRAVPGPLPSPPPSFHLAQPGVYHHSTPFRSSQLRIQKSGEYLNDLLLQFLQDDLRGKLHRKYPIIKFVECVWKFKIEDLPAASKINIPAELVNKYHSSQYVTNQRVQREGERRCHCAFEKI
ncbi:hypothetical protein OBBRIDRAFT_341124 [Obba rivulosa]|uniref:Uncharacterized protein n=1 Tax=Obba rivulosa TaxID=1052685 RepID=A0A8E2AN99_9APHY|nr:hypothetical protein OBBRIDRAFT_341124 [Obba rivulosa]